MGPINRKAKPTLYMDMSVWIKWPIVGAVDVVLILAPLLWVNISCDYDDTFGRCGETAMRIPLMVLTAISTLGQVWILLEWSYGQRQKVWNWILAKWNQVNNNVVDFDNSENEQPELQVLP